MSPTILITFTTPDGSPSSLRVHADARNTAARVKNAVALAKRMGTGVRVVYENQEICK